MATPEIVVFGVGEPGFLQAGRGSAVGKHAQSTTAPPLRSFLRIFTVVETSSDCCNLAQGSSHSIGSRPNSTDWLNLPSPTWSEKVHLHLPLGGDLREGSRL